MNKNKMSKSDSGKLGHDKAKDNIKKYFKNLQIEYFKNPKICKCCKKELLYKKRNNKFCNHSCSAKFHNVGVVRHGISPTLECEWCGEKLRKRNNKFCDSTCYVESKQASKRNKHFINKNVKGLKKLLLWEQRGKCNGCGIYEWNKKEITLDLEHKNGNSENDSWINLECLCPNCHSQTPTFKGRNRGNGRHSRRERYKEGKSY